MKASTQIVAAATALLAVVTGTDAQPFDERATVALGAMTSKGCYSSSTGLTLNDTYTFQSSGHCQQQCVYAANYAVLGLTAKNQCWCGNELPPADKVASSSKCQAGCDGYSEDCGSADGTYFTVYLTGVSADVDNASDSGSDTSSSSSSSSTTSSASSSSTTASTTTSVAPSVITVGTTIVTVTAPAQAASASAAESDSKKSSKANTAGIIAGVVVGIVVIGALAGGAFIFLRHKRRRAIEDEYQRNASINNFVANGKPPGSSAGFSNITDTRLDHSALQRRMSDGSIADNEDYSRKILRVTNA